ncbi:uncharacterized protein LOC130274177 [Hyla sarda]|uniref:uncharacterized protein LOC130274176 n=1 Tax=Hyla sarda TaxID=327740 RepID=UPI0024C41335|nr:uncharacterized protein LOC130274176 [Hyla sarda]XP_056378151.1 uncharacterized protein LOC130274176 [Hyla sarda]XP_056378152.1 uncharacterized protein LOC130274177 [Hyla sarda]XP_056378153.1 uncharacterized protein LOC130274177 [Hyla sarda]
MASNVFHYDQDETDRIIARTTLSSDFLQVPSYEFRTRELERESRHLVNLELHCATLTEYLKVHRIPRGLRVKLRPTIFSDKKDYCDFFIQILNKCSNDIMTLTVDFLQKEIKLLQDKVKTIEAQLDTALNPEELTRTKERLTMNLDKHKKDSEKKKRDKFVRDTEDYLQNHVYRWQDPIIGQRPYYSNRGTSQDTYSSSSEGNEAYYGRGRPGGRRRPQRRRGGFGVPNITESTTTTRSQVR